MMHAEDDDLEDADLEPSDDDDENVFIRPRKRGNTPVARLFTGCTA